MKPYMKEFVNLITPLFLLGSNILTYSGHWQGNQGADQTSSVASHSFKLHKNLINWDFFLTDYNLIII